MKAEDFRSRNLPDGADTMAQVARNALDSLSDEELLRIATTVPPAPPGETPEEQVRRFLAFEGVRPGRSAGVELHFLYYRYVCWLSEHMAGSPSDSRRPEQLLPHLFGRLLSRVGFRRKKAWRRGDARPCLSMHYEEAMRLKKWAKTVDLPEYRRLCKPQRRQLPPQAPEASGKTATAT